MPSLIQPATVSTETEIGIRWSGEQVDAGLALFEIARPYRFERQVVSVWRSEQLSVQNVTDAFAWSYVGGGLAYAMPPSNVRHHAVPEPVDGLDQSFFRARRRTTFISGSSRPREPLRNGRQNG
ncbi:hypothetical protein sS8_5008 [Methylocaldum marinum]|uniref:Uncharacterized protein n=1 Tax=Methylocaldum marinum TaxID=1432792 RepID=A0A250L102_9GAMM|nr:hypothetical protein [Methylocaldum marinum]BBA36931.1 hypothetical protein sS8_5008 [Methylocaldum marinum]